MSNSRLPLMVLKNFVTHAAHAGALPLADMPLKEAIEAITALWKQIELEVPEGERIQAFQLEAAEGAHEGRKFRVFIPPTPEFPNEPYFICVLDANGQRRVFLLEKTQDHEAALVIEWTRTQRRIFGMVPSEVGEYASEFVKVVLALYETNQDPYLETPRAPIFATSLREFTAILEMEARMIALVKDRDPSPTTGAFANRVASELAAAANGENSIRQVRKTWWKFWEK